MILHPECQKRSQEEISRVIGSERLPEFEDMDVLPYTTAIVHEVMRLVHFALSPLVVIGSPLAAVEMASSSPYGYVLLRQLRVH